MRIAPFAGVEAALAAGASGPVLDLGCGGGFWLPRIRALGLEVVGVEEDAGRAPPTAVGSPMVIGDGTRLPFAGDAFGAVWCAQVLHHLDRPGAALLEAHRVLRPGGRLLLVESVEDSPLMRLARRVAPRWEGVPVRSRFRVDELMAMTVAAGFEIVQVRHHSPVSFLALVLPRGGFPLWRALQWAERRLPGLGRWGAHVDCVARSGTAGQAGRRE